MHTTWQLTTATDANQPKNNINTDNNDKLYFYFYSNDSDNSKGLWKGSNVYIFGILGSRNIPMKSPTQLEGHWNLEGASEA